MSRLVPDLARKHFGYFFVVLSLLIAHGGLSIDALDFRPNRTPGFSVVGSLIGGQFWIMTLVHLVILGLLITGLYWRGHFQLLRFGCALSVAICNFLVVGLAFGDYVHDISYALPLLFFTISMASLAAVLEDEDGPRGTVR